MNKVYASIDSRRFLNDREILNKQIKLLKAEGVQVHPYFLEVDPYVFVKERIQGSGHCDCNGNGEFILEPLEECLYKNGGGGKYYMKCRKCGCVSHL